MYINHNVGCVIAREKYMRNLFLVGSFILLTSCSEFALLMSGSSVAISQNSYARAYNAIDLGVVMTTKKGMKQHAYEKGKKYFVDWTRAKALGIMNKH
jgi:hypothetical protein